MAKDPATISARWAQNLGGATQKIQDGVNAVTTAPGAKAAAAQAKYLAGVQAKADKWKTRVGAVSLAEWQAAMTQKGLPRIAQGAQASQGKFQNFMAQFLPYVESQAATVRQMPNLTLEDSVNRAAAMIRANAKFSYKK